MKLFDEEAARLRLHDSRWIISGLKGRGYEDVNIKQFIFWLSQLPNGQWQSAYINSSADDIKRRKRLANKIRKLSEELCDDPEASHVFLSTNRKLSIYSQQLNPPESEQNISDFLSELAEGVEAYQPGTWETPPDSLMPRKLADEDAALKEYIKRVVSHELGAIPGRDKPPYDLASYIVNGLLDISTVSGEDIRKIAW